MKRSWSHGHIYLQARLGNIVPTCVAKGKIDFKRTISCVLHQSIFFHISFLSISYASDPVLCILLILVSLFAGLLTPKLHLLKHFMSKCFFTENMLIIPANSNLLNSRSSLPIVCHHYNLLHFSVIYVRLISPPNYLVRAEPLSY